MILKRKGITLVEMIIALAIMSIIALGLFNVFGLSFRTQQQATKKYEIQSDVSYSSNTFNETVRESTSIFLLNQNKFNRNLATDDIVNNPQEIIKLGMKPGWNYIALNHDRTKIYNFIWNATASGYKIENGSTIQTQGAHIPVLLTLSDKGNSPDQVVKYDLSFTSKQRDLKDKIDFYKNKLSLTQAEKDELKGLEREYQNSRSSINYKIKATIENSKQGYGSHEELDSFDIESTVYAQNTKQIIDVSNNQEVTALAYRTTDFITASKINENPAIALVLDFSTSMDNYMGSRKRVDILKDEYVKIIDKLAANGDFKLHVIIFGNSAHATAAPFEIKRNQNSTDPTLNKDAKEYIKNVNLAGATNYGDGVRVGLNKLKEISTGKSYLLVLSDGAPNTGNRRSDNDQIYPGNDFPVYPNWFGDADGLKFVKQVIDAHTFKPTKVQLVGFSDDPTEVQNLTDIHQYFISKLDNDSNRVDKILAGNAVELEEAFNGFVSTISVDLEHFEGP